ncbi:MAG: hypothetical protein Q9190_003246 [Brigantiaea leucoxantha]
MCANDIAPQVSTSYECLLCPVTHNEQELMEPPKVSHKKKSDREREKERLEREMVLEATEQYNKRQDENGRPRNPREPYKRTSGNCWVHVTCAIWHPEIKFSNSSILEASEGFQSIPATRYEQTCRLCKTNTGACVSCHQCAATFHVACAIQFGHHIGFDVTPVKGSRKDVVSTVTMGNETGNVSAVVYCREHTVKSIVHPMYEAVEGSQLNALQLFARTYKQADLSLTGTVRKAAIINSATRGAMQATAAGNNHRGSTSAAVPAIKSSRVSPAAVTVQSEEFDEDGDRIVHLSDNVISEPVWKQCGSCRSDTSPKWHKLEAKISNDRQQAEPNTGVNGFHSHAQSSQSQDLANEKHTNGTAENFNRHSQPPLVEAHANLNGGTSDANGVLSQETADHPDELYSVSDLDGAAEPADPPAYLCHKCHLKRMRDPKPSEPTSTVATTVEAELPRVQEIDSPSPPVQHLWPPPQPIPSHEPYPPWSGQPASHFAGPPRIPNGITHSPPAVPPPSTTHYRPPPSQYHSPNYRPQHQCHEMPPQHAVNGVPPPYQIPRNTSTHLGAVGYPQHHQPPPPPPRVQHIPPAPRDIPSPRMHHQMNHGPHGPPRAEENPFAIPFQSPRQDYQGIYGSPRSNHERAETPPAGIGRNGIWSPGDSALTNGASANPSLRNLLH